MTMQPLHRRHRLPRPGALDLRGDLPQRSSTRSDHAPTLHADHLYCLQKGCQSGGSSCSPGAVLPAAAGPGRGAPARHLRPQLRLAGALPAQPLLLPASCRARPTRRVCIPGLLGFVCETDIDCLVGKCLARRRARRGRWPQALHRRLQQRRRLRRLRQRAGEVRLHHASDGRLLRHPRRLPRHACHTTTDCTRDDGTPSASSQAPPDEADGPGNLPAALRPRTARARRAAASARPACRFYTSRATAARQTAGCFPGFFGLPCLSDANCVRRSHLPAPIDSDHGAGPLHHALRTTRRPTAPARSLDRGQHVRCCARAPRLRAAAGRRTPACAQQPVPVEELPARRRTARPARS